MAKKVAKAKTKNVKVKKGSEVLSAISRNFAHNIHGRYSLGFSDKTREKLVAYGPWLAILLTAAITPELLIFAKSGTFINFSGFFSDILFNQQSWMILVILFVNIILLVDGLSHLFNKEKKGWDRVYQATLISGAYVLWQLLSNISQPAAPLLSLLAIVFILFSLLDIKSYYK